MTNTFDWVHIDSCIKGKDFDRAIDVYMKALPIVPYKEAKERIIKRVYMLGFKMADGKIVEKELWDG